MAIKEKPAIAVAHPQLGRGGSEADCLWAVQALKDEYDVTLLTTGAVDWQALNSCYGTSIDPGEVAVSRPRRARLLGGKTASALRAAIHQRHCRRMADKFNTLISAYNPCDFGRPAIHRIGDFTWHGEIKNKFDNTREDTKNFIHRNNTARKVYLTLSGALARPSGRDIFSGGDMLVVNSEWTGRMMRERYPDAWIELAYPPVAASFQSVPRENRENGFVCIGRIAPQKRIEDMIEILSEVRRMGHDLHLHVIGGMDGSAYAGLIGKIAENNSGWVHMEGARFGRGKEELLTGHRYALHARRAEPFGISVAETAGAGCITFVPDCGGPPEILGSEPALCYRDKRDAVQKIDRVLRDDELQRRLAAAMPGCALHFSTQHYMDEIRGAVERFRMG